MTESTTYDDLADIYDVWITNMPVVADETCRFYVERYLRATGSVVELGVGNGRILVEAARRGKAVIGVDFSPRMLELCRRKAEQANVIDRVTLLQGDFRQFALERPAALITIPYDSLGHLVTFDKIRDCFRNVHSQLEPGGRFLFDMKVPRTPENDRRPYLYATFINEHTGGEVMLWVTMIHDLARQCRTTYLWTEELDGDGFAGPRKVRRVDNAWLFAAQLRRLLAEAGFEVDEMYGDFAEGPLTGKSDYQVVVARRPER